MDRKTSHLLRWYTTLGALADEGVLPREGVSLAQDLLLGSLNARTRSKGGSSRISVLPSQVSEPSETYEVPTPSVYEATTTVEPEPLCLEDTLEVVVVEPLPDEPSWEVEELQPGYLTLYTYRLGNDVLGLEYKTLPKHDPLIEVFSYESGALEVAFWYQSRNTFPNIFRPQVTNLWNTWQAELEDLEEYNARASDAVGLLRELDVLLNCTIGIP